MTSDLRAHAALHTLTEGERNTYEEQGYVVVTDVFSAEELEDIDREIDNLAEQQAAQPRVDEQVRRGGRQPHLPAGYALTAVSAGGPGRALIQDIVKPGIAIFR